MALCSSLAVSPRRSSAFFLWNQSNRPKLYASATVSCAFRSGGRIAASPAQPLPSCTRCGPCCRCCSCSCGRGWGESLRSSRSGRSTTEKQRDSLRVCYNLGGDSAPEGSISRRQGPRPPWILIAAGVVASGLLLFVKLKTGSLGTVAPEQAGAGLATSTGALTSFNVKLPGLSLALGERTPGWVYFMLLMAAGFGLFVSEEALNVWVGASLARSLSYGSQEAFLTSLKANAPHIVSTILWVYWGVCISDMVPFYAGKLASTTGDQIREKLGGRKEDYEKVTATVQRFGNLIGFVERFSIGIRNPTAFLAGVAGISPAKFFVGVCFGGLITLPLQMSVGFVLRERPVAALAGVAAVVGAWTVFPYAAAGLASLYYFFLRSTKKPAQ